MKNDILYNGQKEELIKSLNHAIDQYQLNEQLLVRFLGTCEECKHYKSIDRKITAKHTSKFPDDRCNIDDQYTRQIRFWAKGVDYDFAVTIYIRECENVDQLMDVVRKQINNVQESIAMFKTDLQSIDALTAIEKELSDKRKAAREKFNVTYITNKYFPRVFEGFDA